MQVPNRGISIVITLVVAVLVVGATYYFLKPNHAIPSRDLLSGKPELLTFYDQGIAAEQDMTKTPPSPQPFLNAGIQWATIGTATNDKRWFEEARWVYEQADRVLEGKNSLVLSNLADTLTQLGKYDDAKKTYERALELSPGDVSYYQALITLMRYKMKASPDDILAVYAEGMKRVVGAGELYMSRAAYYRDIGRFADARADIDLAHKGGAIDDARYAQALRELESAKNQ